MSKEILSIINRATGKPGQQTAANTWYSPAQLSGGGLQNLMDDAEGDEDLGKIVHSLQTHGAAVPPPLVGVQPVPPQ